MQTTVYILGIVAIVVLIGVIYALYQKMQMILTQKQEDKSFLMLQNQLNDMAKNFNDRLRDQDLTLNNQLQKSNETLNKQFGVSTKVLQDINSTSSKIIKEVTEKLAKLDETNNKIVDFAKQMQSLENILKNPKQRGILGEYFLENMLSNSFPPDHYQMQYMFKSDGKIVDAAIFIEDKILPIDAKFSLEMYNRIMEETDKEKRKGYEKEFKQAIKLRIDETSKYIRPDEKTVDIAMMFIPADGVFYNLLTYEIGSVAVNTNNLIEYAFSKKVILVSPMLFFAYLQTIVQSIHKFKVKKNLEEIIDRIGKLDKHVNAYDSYMNGLGKSLEGTVNKYNTAYTEFKKVDKDIHAITQGEAGGQVEVLLIDKPKTF